MVKRAESPKCVFGIIFGEFENEFFRCFKNAGLPEPVIEEIAGGLQLTLYKRSSKDPGTTPQEKVLNLIKLNDRISKNEIGQILGITRGGVSYHIKRLRKSGVLDWVGSPGKGHWVVKF